MTKKMTPEGTNVEQPICNVGSATDNPCPRLATEYVNQEDRPDFCWPHFFSLRVRTTAEDISMMLGDLEAELERRILSQEAEQ